MQLMVWSVQSFQTNRSFATPLRSGDLGHCSPGANRFEQPHLCVGKVFVEVLWPGLVHRQVRMRSKFLSRIATGQRRCVSPVFFSAMCSMTSCQVRPDFECWPIHHASGPDPSGIVPALLARKLGGHFPNRRHVTAKPKEVTILCGKRLVLAAEHFPCPFNRLSSVHITLRA